LERGHNRVYNRCGNHKIDSATEIFGKDEKKDEILMIAEEVAGTSANGGSETDQ